MNPHYSLESHVQSGGAGTRQTNRPINFNFEIGNESYNIIYFENNPTKKDGDLTQASEKTC